MFDRIRQLCREKGVSMSTVEKDCGLGENSIFKWKNSMPSVEKVAKVAQYFGVSIDYL